MKIKIINGPNMNMLGRREPDLYGVVTYEGLVEYVKNFALKNNVDVEFFQSNYEGALIDEIQKAYFDNVDGIVINPAAYSHTSIGILDALKAVNIPAVEVHMTDISEREEFRRKTYTSLYCFKIIKGLGKEGYIEAIKELMKVVK